MGIINTHRTNTETKTHISEKSIRWCRFWCSCKIISLYRCNLNHYHLTMYINNDFSFKFLFELEDNFKMSVNILDFMQYLQ